MKLIIIAAIARNRTIGKNGKLPWHLPEDLARFKQMTIGQTVVMGRKTFESLDRPFPNRLNIVISSKVINGVTSYPSLEFALQALSGKKEVFVIGGARLFAEALKIADELRLTLIDRDVDGDAYFPPYEDYLRKNFRLMNEEYNIGFSFVDYVRIT
ncbi:MAG: dihydrofolate reductase [Ignavibacteriae bacterium]|nr:MAG: dihydrofolate reductase [Ignavibacteriota bacterium]